MHFEANHSQIDENTKLKTKLKTGNEPGQETLGPLAPSSYKTHLKLSIRHLTIKDFGSYRCVAKNPRGETDGTIKIYRKSCGISLSNTPSARNNKKKKLRLQLYLCPSKNTKELLSIERRFPPIGQRRRSMGRTDRRVFYGFFFGVFLPPRFKERIDESLSYSPPKSRPRVSPSEQLARSRSKPPARWDPIRFRSREREREATIGWWR